MAIKKQAVEVDNNDPYPPSSRYKDTKYFKRDIEGIGERIEPETWEPVVLEDEGDFLVTEVQPGEEGRLDLVSLRVYRTSSLWWVLAYVNNVIDPFEDVTSQLKLKFPPFSKVAASILS